MIQRWQGLFPAVITKFHADESIGDKSFATNLETQIATGVDGISVGGSLGEVSALSLTEKQDVLKSAVEAVGGEFEF